MSAPLQAWPTSMLRPGNLQRHSQRLSRLRYVISTSLFREAAINGLTDESASEPFCEGLKSRPAIIRLSLSREVAKLAAQKGAGRAARPSIGVGSSEVSSAIARSA